MRRPETIFFGSKFVVKYWHLKHENRECCPQLVQSFNSVSAGLAFSAVTIAVSEAFLLSAAENWHPEKSFFFWHRVRSLIFIAKPRTTNGLEPQHEAVSSFSFRFCLARTDFKSWGAKNGLAAAQIPNFPPFSSQKRLRNG